MGLPGFESSLGLGPFGLGRHGCGEEIPNPVDLELLAQLSILQVLNHGSLLVDGGLPRSPLFFTGSLYVGLRVGDIGCTSRAARGTLAY